MSTAAEGWTGDRRTQVTKPRPIIIHYHLFKNAGTSLDRTLRQNFGVTWATIEHEPTMRPAELRTFLVENPWATVVSSHTAVLPLPRMRSTHIIPIFFLRHPLDRVRSIYDFERQQDAQTAGAVKAKELDMPAFVAWRLERARTVRDHALSDFQAYRLAFGTPDGSMLERALATLEVLPFVGLVEDYESSLARLQGLLADYFPSIHLKVQHANVTASRADSLDERLEDLRQRVGDELYRELESMNQVDMRVWERARELFG
jgi:hypothetical protein